MAWFKEFTSSSIGQKIVMSLTGLFLITFLIVHLIGNLQLLIPDEGKTFNLYADFMTTNPFIKTTSYLLYAAILWHALHGLYMWRTNTSAKGSRYAVTPKGTTSFASRNMAWLGIIIFVFILIHMYQFWFQMKFGDLPLANYDGQQVKNLYTPVHAAFTNPLFTIFYVISMIVIALHLNHGFQSAFQTLGLNHKKYTPLIKGVGAFISIVIPLGFAIIPIYFLVAL